MSALKQQLQEDMKTAMRAKEKDRLGVIRLIMAALKQKEVDERIELDDAQILAILDKMVKQRKDSITQYQTANRQDLVDQETFELNLIQTYLPQALTEAEINDLITAAIQTSGASAPQDMGKVMGILKPQMQGRADMKQVSGLVKQQLAQ